MLVALAALAFAGASCVPAEPRPILNQAPAVEQFPVTSSPRPDVVRPIDLAPFMDTASYARQWAAGSEGKKIANVRAGVVNHHVLAGDLLVQFMRTLKVSRPDATRFVILAPDHFAAGRHPASVTTRPYRLDGVVRKTDAAAIAKLASLEFVGTEDDGMFELEHGVGAVAAYLFHEFPNATVIPVAFSASIRTADAEALGRVLADIADDHTVFIVSADMSHYLVEDRAAVNDRTTLDLLARLDAKRLGGLNDDFVDNRPSFVALREALGGEGADLSWTLLDHSISTRYGGSAANTTSYITGVWSKK